MQEQVGKTERGAPAGCAARTRAGSGAAVAPPPPPLSPGVPGACHERACKAGFNSSTGRIVSLGGLALQSLRMHGLWATTNGRASRARHASAGCPAWRCRATDWLRPGQHAGERRRPRRKVGAPPAQEPGVALLSAPVHRQLSHAGDRGSQRRASHSLARAGRDAAVGRGGGRAGRAARATSCRGVPRLS